MPIAISFLGLRMISGKAMREIDPGKPKPFPYKKRDFSPFWAMADRTTYRQELILIEDNLGR